MIFLFGFSQWHWNWIEKFSIKNCFYGFRLINCPFEALKSYLKSRKLDKSCLSEVEDSSYISGLVIVDIVVFCYYLRISETTAVATPVLVLAATGPVLLLATFRLYFATAVQPPIQHSTRVDTKMENGQFLRKNLHDIQPKISKASKILHLQEIDRSLR